MSPLLKVDGIQVRLGGRTILDDVSFALEAGQFAGLIGVNGAGKTTLFRVLLGLQRPNAGSVLVDGATLGKRRRGVGYVPQKIALEADAPLRARDLVMLGIDGERYGLRLPSRERRDRVEEMLAAVGAESFANARVGTLSGGEQQRVLIAHALVSRPRLLLADEPLANLDISAGHEIVELLDRVSHEHGVSVLLSAHDINPLLGSLDQVVYLAEGRAAAGPTDEVIDPEVLSRLYRHPVHVLRVDGRVLVVAGAHVGIEGADGAH